MSPRSTVCEMVFAVADVQQRGLGAAGGGSAASDKQVHRFSRNSSVTFGLRASSRRRGGRSEADTRALKGTGPRRRERLRHRRGRLRRCGPPSSVHGCRGRRSARRRVARRRRSRRRRGTPGQSPWSAPRRSCGRRRGTGFGCGCWRRTRGSRAERAADLLGGVGRPEAKPASCGSVPVTAAIVADTNASPNPTPASNDGPRTSAANEPPVAGTRENHSRPPATSSMPAIRGGLKPTRVTTWEAAAAERMIATESGR